ncbi:MAG: hypothetical protein JW822_13805 [Spirochaetales bacterium]|nr:hypothetical protein [Spirochaetales bacterium]
MPQWYKELFKDYARAYDNESFTQGTSGECDFIEKEIEYNTSLSIIDVEGFCAAANKEGDAVYKNNTFDLLTFRDHNITTIEDDFGNKKELECNERYYVPSEITWLLKTLHYRKIDIYGAKLGAFSRNDPLTIDDFEMMVIAEK